MRCCARVPSRGATTTTRCWRGMPRARGGEPPREPPARRAPGGGFISRRYVQAGDRVDFGKPVVDLVDTRTLQLSASVEAEWLGALRVGRAVSLGVSQLPGDSVTGRISRINPTADPAT